MFFIVISFYLFIVLDSSVAFSLSGVDFITIMLHCLVRSLVAVEFPIICSSTFP